MAEIMEALRMLFDAAQNVPPGTTTEYIVSTTAGLYMIVFTVGGGVTAGMGWYLLKKLVGGEWVPSEMPGRRSRQR